MAGSSLKLGRWVALARRRSNVVLVTICARLMLALSNIMTRTRGEIKRMLGEEGQRFESLGQVVLMPYCSLHCLGQDMRT